MAPTASWSIPFANDGGPLIVLPRELLGDWQGSRGAPESKDFPFGPDYARACKAEHPAELLEVGRGLGLVIGAQEHVFPADWLRLPERRGVALIGWSYAEDGSRARVAELLANDALSWRRLPAKVRLTHGDVVLLHAASAGAEVRELDTFGEGHAVIGDGMPIRLEPGDYAIECVEIGGDLQRDELGCVVCRWNPFV